MREYLRRRRYRSLNLELDDMKKESGRLSFFYMGALESHQGISRGKTIRVAPVLVFPLATPFPGHAENRGAYVKLVVSEMTDRCGLIVKHMGYVRLLSDKIRVSVQSYDVGVKRSFAPNIITSKTNRIYIRK